MEHHPEMALRFTGSAREYFKIWIVNLCLTLLTLGIFSAWAKVRKKRYTYSHTTLGGTPFQYLGQPVPILRGRLIAAAGFSTYYVSSNFITALLPYIVVLGFLVAPWVVKSSAAFNARYSAYRNISFDFDCSYLQALKAICAWGVVPLIAIGMLFNVAGQPAVFGIATIVAGLFFPWWIRRLKHFIVSHSSYGGIKGMFTATGGQFFKIYLISGLIVIFFAIPTGVVSAMVFSLSGKSDLLMYLPMIVIYTGYVLSYAYIKSRSGNLVWNSTQIGPIRFQSTLRATGLAKLYLTNALGIIVSCGLLIPWAVIRTIKYRTAHMHVFRSGEITEFKNIGNHRVTAVGSETMDLFDMDLSL